MLMSAHVLIQFIELVLATAQAGLTFSKDPYDIERFAKLRAISAQFLARTTSYEVSEVEHWIDLDEGYPTPKFDVRAIVLDEQNRLLLVRERADSRWTVPGGWSDIGESPAEAIQREVLEETGLQVKATHLLAIFDKHKHAHPPQLPHAYKAFFSCAVTGGELLQGTVETSEARYFDLLALPELSFDRVLPEQLRTLHSRILAGENATLFD
jgi:ADP-ribose pyrophosphatase YjhB (NUDIX family)